MSAATNRPSRIDAIINASVKTIAVTQPMTRPMSSVIFAAFAFK
jgi:hypothetical protein